MTTDTILQVCLWVGTAAAVIAVPTCAYVMVTVHREEKRRPPRVAPLGPAELREVAAELGRLAERMTTLADRQERPVDERAGASA